MGHDYALQKHHAELAAVESAALKAFNPDQPRADDGKWSDGDGGSGDSGAAAAPSPKYKPVFEVNLRTGLTDEQKATAARLMGKPVPRPKRKK